MKTIATIFLLIFGLVFTLPAVNSFCEDRVSAGFNIDEEKRSGDKQESGKWKKDFALSYWQLGSTIIYNPAHYLHLEPNLPSPFLEQVSLPPNRTAVG
ncbi:MAG: hypothetical protein ACK4E0_00670 [Chitinophagaceae bacterium]|jgi:hypothetical protein